MPVNSHRAEPPSVTRMPSAAEKVSGAAISWASTVPVQKASGGHTTTARSPATRV